ncbi:hypothetical protein SDC9_129113 [bioreactor metagenome]|uniref:Uncharacterized protein n=1 Tax=bioreactor metagenome TaxID=1076179 RepID=A0A645CYV0_9ZZZZ
MRRTFEPGLENQLGGDRIEQRLRRLGIASGLAQARLGVERAEPLVGHGDRQIEAFLQTLGELRRQAGHFVRRAIGVRRQADDQALRLPFGDQLADRRKTLVVRLGMNHRQRMRRCEQRLAGGDADPLFAEIESEHRPHVRRDQRRRKAARN